MHEGGGKLQERKDRGRKGCRLDDARREERSRRRKKERRHMREHAKMRERERERDSRPRGGIQRIGRTRRKEKEE
jgi:hypothetical protein